MSTEPRSPAKKDATSSTASPENKGKGKACEPVSPGDVEDDESEEDEDEDEEAMDQDDDGEEEEEEDLAEIDPSAIRSRRTRGIRVDYTSPAALEKAGLTKEELEREDEEMKI